MTNNDILRRIRYLFDFSDLKMIALFKLVNYDVSRADLSDWLKNHISISDKKYIQRTLILGLYTLTPPRRNEYGNVMLISPTDYENIQDTKKNYLVLYNDKIDIEKCKLFPLKYFEKLRSIPIFVTIFIYLYNLAVREY